MKIVSIVGARPQFIKCAPLSRVLRRRHEEILIHTGQHYDETMSGIFFKELALPNPDYNLGIGSGSHGEQTGRMLSAIEKVLSVQEPAMVLVYGDTNSTLAGALAAAKLHIPVAHVEAGLRSFDRTMPEEVNRVLTDHLATLLFAPTETGVANLASEGVTDNVFLTGDVMVDALISYQKNAMKSRILDQLGLSAGAYYLATVHRASNTDDATHLRSIMGALSVLDRPVIFPVHPRTRKFLQLYGIDSGANCTLIEPLPYPDILSLMIHAAAVLTDSGGVQKEAYILQVPCITLRTNTEWIETVQDGWNILAGADRQTILHAIRSLHEADRRHSAHYGDGTAAEQIGSIITSYGERS